MKTERRIRNIREEKEISQQTIANHLGIDIKTYNRYENGLHEIKTSTLIKLATYYNLSLDYITGLIDIPKKLKENTKDFELTENEKKLLKAYKDNPQLKVAIDKLLDLED